jgi:hypothetical protein
MTDEEIKASVTEKAIRYGVPRKYSALYDELDIDFTISFEKEIADRQFGLPIVRFSHPNGHWVLIGTKELAWYDNDRIQFIDINNINGFEPMDKKEAREKAESNGTDMKLYLEQLGLKTVDGKVITLFIEPWLEYFTFWHMMIRIFKLI